jgi:hypothetical protein
MIPLKTQAIQTALTGDWDRAITFNQMLLEDNPDDIDTLNRLAYAQASLGNIKEAKNIYQKVLNLDIQNPIALRNLKRLNSTFSTKAQATPPNLKMTNLFIEEPGKTKVIELINVAEQKITSQLRCGEFLSLSVKRSKIFVLDNQKQYIGMLPDDISRRLIEFINGGNEYEAYVKTVQANKVIIFVRELKRGTRYKYQSSFISADKPKFLIETKGKTKGKANHKAVQDSEDEDDDRD